MITNLNNPNNSKKPVDLNEFIESNGIIKPMVPNKLDKSTFKPTFKSAFKKLLAPIALIVVFVIIFTTTLFVVVSAEGGGAGIVPPDTIENGENTDRDTNIDENGEGSIEMQAPSDSSVLNDLIGVDGSQPIEILLLITLLSVAPSILLMMTSFTRIIIVFGFLRNAMSTQSTPPNQILTGLALFLTMFIMWPVFSEINDTAYQPYADGEYTAWEAVEAAGKPLKTFMLRQTTNTNMIFFMDLADATIYDTDPQGNQTQVTPTDEINMLNYQEQLSLRVVIPAFMISELSRAFQMGFMLFIPFLIIDLVVASTLMSMGMMMLPPAMISLPFKIMLFVLVDGWQLLVGSLVTSFNFAPL